MVDLVNLCITMFRPGASHEHAEMEGKELEFSIYDLFVEENNGKKEFFIGVRIFGTGNPFKPVLISRLVFKNMQQWEIKQAANYKGIGMKKMILMKNLFNRI